MKVIRTANQKHGFFGEIADSKGVEAATGAWSKAFVAVRESLDKTHPRQLPDWEPLDIRNFLDSKFGRFTAEAVLEGESVAQQISNRPQRFIRNFTKVVKDRHLYKEGE